MAKPLNDYVTADGVILAQTVETLTNIIRTDWRDTDAMREGLITLLLWSPKKWGERYVLCTPMGQWDMQSFRRRLNARGQCEVRNEDLIAALTRPLVDWSVAPGTTDPLLDLLVTT